MKQPKNKKTQRKPSRPAKCGSTVKEIKVEYTPECDELINTIFRTILRNINNGNIDIKQLPMIATIVPMLTMKHFKPNITRTEFLQMVWENWLKVEEDLRPIYEESRHCIMEQSKTDTLNDEM
jgi:hypothetical protein